MVKKLNLPSHETFNTLFTAATFLLAAITAWFQFSPESDNIQIVSQERVRSNTEIKITVGGLPLPQRNDKTMTIGPVNWRVVLFNPTGHAVPMTSLSVTYAHPEGPIFSSDMVTGVLNENDGRPIAFPLMLAPHEARSIIIGIRIPVKAIAEPSERACKARLVSFEDFQNCIFDQGRDLFGNKGHRIGQGLLFLWDEEPIGPSFSTKIATAEGFETSTLLTFYPELRGAR